MNGPIAITSRNGLEPARRAHQEMLSGADVLDAAVAGVNLVELDPNEHTVGYGGLPNLEGIVQLDAAVMHGPTGRAGAAGRSGRREAASQTAPWLAPVSIVTTKLRPQDAPNAVSQPS